MNQQELRHFLEKMASGQHTNQEHQAFTDWVENCSREEYEQMLICWEEIVGDIEIADPIESHLVKKIELGLDLLDERISKQDAPLYEMANRQRSLWPRITVAASILILLSISIHFLYQSKQVNRKVAQNHTHDVAPGGNKAILTLANGQKIVLDNEKNGVIANQGGTAVNKQQDGQLVYNSQPESSSASKGVAPFDTLTTPRAGIYHITLTDGSKVWLNSATSIRYPAAFRGKYRTVELLYGEAFYEVTHNDKMPFQVITAGQTIEDIGTQFDVNAYKDEPVVKTTLLEGSVSVSEGKETKILKPGQQSQLAADGTNRKIRIIDDVDTDEIMAWKNGLFQFTDADIQTIMRQLARWYDVEVVYDGKISKRLFTGDIHRNINASEAMQILAYLKIDYKIIDKKIIITSNRNQ